MYFRNFLDFRTSVYYMEGGGEMGKRIGRPRKSSGPQEATMPMSYRLTEREKEAIERAADLVGFRSTADLVRAFVRQGLHALASGGPAPFLGDGPRYPTADPRIVADTIRAFLEPSQGIAPLVQATPAPLYNCVLKWSAWDDVQDCTGTSADCWRWVAKVSPMPVTDIRRTFLDNAKDGASFEMTEPDFTIFMDRV